MGLGSGIASAGAAIGGAISKQRSSQRDDARRAESERRRRTEYDTAKREMQAEYREQLRAIKADYDRRMADLARQYRMSAAESGGGLGAGMDLGEAVEPLTELGGGSLADAGGGSGLPDYTSEAS